MRNMFVKATSNPSELRKIYNFIPEDLNGQTFVVFAKFQFSRT